MPFLTEAMAYLVAFGDDLAPNMLVKVCSTGSLACGCFPSMDVLGNVTSCVTVDHV